MGVEAPQHDRAASILERAALACAIAELTCEVSRTLCEEAAILRDEQVESAARLRSLRRAVP
jgi:hypothetical protein